MTPLARTRYGTYHLNYLASAWVDVFRHPASTLGRRRVSRSRTCAGSLITRLWR